ncbi:MAG: homoserine dehydrogenase [Thermoflavifilum sp.]|nr:homoserine dehydrogenase [Thermoflavifilum sp.]MCL6513881.1 homoserine dehydrogenase [Alicyclobacillus sp.]
MKRLRLGLLGCGVVGGGVVEGIHRNADHIAAQTGVEVCITRIAVRDLSRPRTPHVRREWLTDDWRQVCEAPDVDVVVEVMGGLHPALEATRLALVRGKHVVTANKQLMALHGEHLLALAADSGREILYEASVLGGIPAIHNIRTYFRATRVQHLRGILNGTCNYILTRMEEGLEFDEALRQAQAEGYAEADPTLDIDGWDALYKIQILAALAFHERMDVTAIAREGIRSVSGQMVREARARGQRVRLVAEAERTPSGRVTARVGPQWLDPADPLYNVNGVQNALCVSGDLAGSILLAGPGAGRFPTASAVMEDIVKLAGQVRDVRRMDLPLSVSAG